MVDGFTFSQLPASGFHLVYVFYYIAVLNPTALTFNDSLSKQVMQVRNRSCEWISAHPVPGTFVCNIGDMLKILSNGLYDSTLHRVINTSPTYRFCVAYFYEPNYDAAVEPLEVCVQKSGGTRKLEKAVYGEHLVSKVQTNFVM
ncbi:probable 2-oxoglutarate-dependent dioxygenase At3g50210 [Hibiscus syriacus]|uniref:probable 2-oxoglutarate-dependent dioxygenase At3g50210 n=1 Tax=Hibiscus syriacus TaxID=106335 RepID=UPI001921F57C|nr:probable 2-oxoglutarate-dependent dioxygenase At3g50210 [Hibiscus syriacus]